MLLYLSIKALLKPRMFSLLYHTVAPIQAAYTMAGCVTELVSIPLFEVRGSETLLCKSLEFVELVQQWESKLLFCEVQQSARMQSKLYIYDKVIQIQFSIASLQKLAFRPCILSFMLNYTCKLYFREVIIHIITSKLQQVIKGNL